MLAPQTELEWRMAEAIAILKQYGGGAEVHVAERIAAMVLDKDVVGIRRWQDIGKALDDILRPKGEV